MGNYVTNVAEIEAIFADDQKKTKKLEQALKDTLSGAINAYNREELESKRDSAKYKVARALHDQMQYIRNGAIAFLIALSLALTSCNKSPIDTPTPPDTRQYITQTFGLTTTKESDIHANKNYNPNTFIIAYSDTKYVLTVSNEMNTYTKLCSINELIAGTISITMIRGVYTVSYNPILDNENPYTSTLNVSVNITGESFDGTPKILPGVNMQSLIIIDLGGITVNTMLGATLYLEHKMPEDFWYTYTHIPFNVKLNGVSDGHQYSEVHISPLALGKLYWVVPSLGITYQMNIPSLETVQVPITLE